MDNSGIAAEVGNANNDPQVSVKEKRSKTIEKIKNFFIKNLLFSHRY